MSVQAAQPSQSYHLHCPALPSVSLRNRSDPHPSAIYIRVPYDKPGRVAQSVGHLTRKSVVLGSIPGLATYFRFSFR